MLCYLLLLGMVLCEGTFNFWPDLLKMAVNCVGGPQEQDGAL